MQKDLEYYQSAYFSLKTHFDEVCDIVKATPSQAQITKELQDKDARIKCLTHQVQELTCELETIQAEQNRNNIKEKTLQDVYLSSRQIKKFTTSIKKYGNQFETLKKRQFELTKTISQNYTNKSVKNGMNLIYRDIVQTEASYHSLFECLDVMKTESEGKELELITKDKQYIALLEKEKLFQSSYMEDYVKKIQTLQTELTDREMKLRQTQNKLDMFCPKRVNYQSNYQGHEQSEFGDCSAW